MNQTAYQEAVEIELSYESGDVGLPVLFLASDGILQGSVNISDYLPFKMWPHWAPAVYVSRLLPKNENK